MYAKKKGGRWLALAIVGVSLMTAPSIAADRTYISPSQAASDAFAKLPQHEPIHMLNMIRFKEKADYAEDSGFADKGWSGERAYQEYGNSIRHIAERVGSSVVYAGVPQLTMIGPDGEKWDAIFVVRYPNAEAFFGLVSDKEYLQHAFHRSAAVADSRLIRLAEPPLQ